MWPLDVSSSAGCGAGCDFATNPSEVTSARSHSPLRLRGESAGVGASGWSQGRGEPQEKGNQKEGDEWVFLESGSPATSGVRLAPSKGEVS